MNLDIPLDIVQTAESKLAAAESDLKSKISATKARATGQVGAAIKGDINTACVELIENWSRQADQVTAILTEFKNALAATRSRTSEDSATQARLIAGIDVHAARLG